MGIAEQPLRIAVVGEREATSENRALARAVGAEIGRRGAVLFCGGMGGVMEAAAEGAAAAGGTVIGILPTADAADANAYVAIPVVTGMGEARNAIIARSADAMIAIGGSYGTLSEIALALRFGVPVIGIGTWRVDAPSVDVDPIIRARSPDEAVARACDLAQRRRIAS